PTITARSRKADAPGVWRPQGSRGRYGSAVRAGPSLRRLTALSLVLACGVARGAPGQPPPAARGLRVERVKPLFEAAKAGLQAGDVLLRWARGEERGELESPFELAWLEIEQAPRGAVRLEGLRGGESQYWTLHERGWSMSVRPALPASIESLYDEGLALVQSGKAADAAQRWRAAAQTPTEAPRWLPAWLLARAGEQLADARLWKASDEAYGQALQSAQGAGPIALTQLLRAWAEASLSHGDTEGGEQRAGAMLDAAHALGPESLTLARALSVLGDAARSAGNTAKAEEPYQQALMLRRHLAPGSLAVASSLCGLGGLRIDARADLDKATEDLREALAIQEAHAPDGLDVAMSLSGLASIAVD